VKGIVLEADETCYEDDRCARHEPEKAPALVFTTSTLGLRSKEKECYRTYVFWIVCRIPETAKSIAKRLEGPLTGSPR